MRAPFSLKAACTVTVFDSSQYRTDTVPMNVPFSFRAAQFLYWIPVTTAQNHTASMRTPFSLKVWLESPHKINSYTVFMTALFGFRGTRSRAW